MSQANETLVDEFASIADVAHALDVHTATIRRWARTGTLPRPVRLGRLMRYHVPTLRRWIAEQQRLTTTAVH